MPVGDVRAPSSRRRHALASPAWYVPASLTPLAAHGHRLLAGCSWQGDRRAMVDVVVVGPGGVFLVELLGDDVALDDDRLRRGPEDVTGVALRLADIAYRLEGVLAEIGLAPGEVRPVVTLAGRTGLRGRIGPVCVVGEDDLAAAIAGRGRRLTPPEVDLVLGLVVEAMHPEVDGAQDVLPAVPSPSLAPDGWKVATLPDEPSELDELIGDALGGPLQRWMALLEPVQAKLVRHSFPGPCRITGPVGTGKTVVALHRAAYLARSRPGPVLFTSYLRTLPAALRPTLAALAPDVADAVELCGVHEVARRILDEHGFACRITAADMHAAWTAAWARVAAGSPLDAGPEGQWYWHEEVLQVIKGRGLIRYEQYERLPRQGRRLPLPPEARSLVWDLYVAYQEELAVRDAHDYADQILLALAAVASRPGDGPYSAIVVDEAQDLSCAMLRLLHTLVGDVPDGLTLVDDGQQGVYPGGFSLAEAGIDVAGRTVLLDVNHRSTEQVLTFAAEIVSGDEHADLGGGVARFAQPTKVLRRGPRPVFLRCPDEADRCERVVRRVQEVVAAVGTGFGDVGVLSMTHRDVDLVSAALRRAGIPVALLADDALGADAVRVGTVKRAKGLEFKQVLVVGVDVAWFGPATDLDPVEQERRELRLRELYVAATRARDGLWVVAG